MNSLTIQIEKAKIAYHQGAYLEVLSLLQEGLQSDLFANNSNGKLIIPDAILDAVDLVERFTELPEFVKNEFVDATLQSLRHFYMRFQQGEKVYEELYLLIHQFYLIVNALKGGAQVLANKGVEIGKKTDPSITFSIKKGEEGMTLQLYGRISKYEGGMTQDEAQDLQNAFLNLFEAQKGSKSDLLNLAIKLHIGKRYEESIACFEKIIEKFPDDNASSYNLIGANYFFLGEYEKAIDFYLKALETGEDLDTIDFNVWESCVELIRQNPEKTDDWRRFYREKFPQGKREL